MQLARVMGTAVSTIKHETLVGWRLLVVQPLAPDETQFDGLPLLALDRLGARRGDTVICSSDGEHCRQLVGDPRTPARVAVVGIRDSSAT